MQPQPLVLYLPEPAASNTDDSPALPGTYHRFPEKASPTTWSDVTLICDLQRRPPRSHTIFDNNQEKLHLIKNLTIILQAPKPDPWPPEQIATLKLSHRRYYRKKLWQVGPILSNELCEKLRGLRELVIVQRCWAGVNRDMIENELGKLVRNWKRKLRLNNCRMVVEDGS